MSKMKLGQHEESFESFLEAQGIVEEVYREAISRVLAWKLEDNLTQRDPAES